MGYIKQIVIGFILVAVMVLAVKLQIDLNEMNRENVEAKKRLEELKYENEKLQSEKDAPMDAGYVEKIASEQLGYVDPDAQYFYNDLPN